MGRLNEPGFSHYFKHTLQKVKRITDQRQVKSSHAGAGFVVDLLNQRQSLEDVVRIGSAHA